MPDTPVSIYFNEANGLIGDMVAEAIAAARLKHHRRLRQLVRDLAIAYPPAVEREMFTVVDQLAGADAHVPVPVTDLLPDPERSAALLAAVVTADLDAIIEWGPYPARVAGLLGLAEALL